MFSANQNAEIVTRILLIKKSLVLVFSRRPGCPSSNDSKLKENKPDHNNVFAISAVSQSLFLKSLIGVAINNDVFVCFYITKKHNVKRGCLRYTHVQLVWRM